MRRLTIASAWFGCAIVLGLVAGACNDTRLPAQSSPTQTGPTAPTTVQPTKPPNFYTLEGRVYDSFYDALADVPVEVIERPLTGTIVRTDRNGLFELPGEFSEEITVVHRRKGLGLRMAVSTGRVFVPIVETSGAIWMLNEVDR